MKLHYITKQLGINLTIEGHLHQLHLLVVASASNAKALLLLYV